MLNKITLFLFNLTIMSFSFTSADARQTSPYIDTSHYSKVFGRTKLYRIYLPGGYEVTNKRYPVVYFFHGWGGRHFKDDNALLEYERIKDIVDRYEIILVMWDGNMEESNPRPYNIGNHKDIIYDIQMKDYFIELISHIDSTYPALTGRNNRAIIGFSMGGIMSFLLVGKYPDKVCAAVNLAGTPEFFIGYPGNHTLYPLRYTFRNLKDVKIRQHSGNTDILVYLNEEVRKGAEWEGCPYPFYRFPGGHMVDKPGETAAFEMAVKFVTGAFGGPVVRPQRWSHYDLYGDFSLWDYTVKSNKTKPGFILLKNVGKNGFGLYTHKWLPDGPNLDSIGMSVTTAGVYDPGKMYHTVLFDLNEANVGLTQKNLIADNEGRLTFQYTGSGFETGIYTDNDAPDFVIGSWEMADQTRYLRQGRNAINLKILNRGGTNLKNRKVTVGISTGDTSVVIENKTTTFMFDAAARVTSLGPISLVCHKIPPPHGEPFQVKLDIEVTFDAVVQSGDAIIPVLFDVPLFEAGSISVDDGIAVRDRSYGKGNGNGTADAGERVMLYHGQHRLRLYTNDPWIVIEEEELADEQLPSVWEDSFTLSSVVSVNKNCPAGHIIEITASYETITYNPIERKVHWGTIHLPTGTLK